MKKREIVSMKKWKKKPISVVAVIVILGLIIMLPQIYFGVLDHYVYQKEHKMEEINFELDSDVKNIKMVNRLHELQNSYYDNNSERVVLCKGEYSDIVLEPENIKKAKAAFEKAKIFQCIYGGDFSEFGYSEVHGSGKGVEKYQFQSTHTDLEMKLDNQTGKITYLKYHGKNIKKIDDEEIRELEKEYIKYMNLSLVDDWNYNNKKMISKKAHLAAETVVDTKKNTLELTWKVID